MNMSSEILMERKENFILIILFYFLKSSLEFYFNCFSDKTFFNI